MKKRDWIFYSIGIVSAWLLLDIGFEINSRAIWLSWMWLLGFVVRNVGFILMLLLGIYVGLKINSKETED